MLGDALLDDIAAKARAVRQLDTAVLNGNRIGHDVVAPRHVVVFVLEDLFAAILLWERS